MKCAAICSSVVVSIYEGLEVLAENIQDRTGLWLSSMSWAQPILFTENFTRFYILSQGRDIALPEGHPPSTENMALLRLQPPGDSMKPVLNITRIINTLDMLVKRIDRRPTDHGRPFEDVYFLEVCAIPGQSSPELPWIKQLQQAVDKIKHMDVEISVLGCW